MSLAATHTDDLSLDHLRRDIQGYSMNTFRQDAIAGLSVALLTIPQAMAYALAAGLPISCGLLAAVFSAMITAFFGSSRHLVTGPSNAIAILIQSGTAEILYGSYRYLTGAERELMAVHILTQLTVLVGIFQLLAAGFKLGRLTQFVSHSVVVAYIAGTAIAVVLNQMYTFLGVSPEGKESSLYEKGAYLLTNWREIHWPTAMIGGVSMGIMLFLKRVNKRIPAAVISFILMGCAVYFLETFATGIINPYDPNAFHVAIVGDTGTLEQLRPAFAFPFFDPSIMNNLLPVAFAIALLSVMDATFVARTLAASSGQRLSLNQDIYALGWGNLFSSFIGAMPISGSPTRSGVNFSSGAQTRFAAILNCIMTGMILYALGFLVTQIPLASLSALLLITAWNIVNREHLLICLKATPGDTFVFWSTILACIFFSLDTAFYIGVVLSITLYLKKAAVPQVVEFAINEKGELRNLDATSSKESKKIRVIKVKGELFFGAADIFQSTLKSFAEDDVGTRVIVLQLKNARDMDATACLALHHLKGYLSKSGRHLIACGLTPAIWEVLSDSGMVDDLGKENLFLLDEKQPHLYMQKALERAKELLAEPTLSDEPKEQVPDAAILPQAVVPDCSL